MLLHKGLYRLEKQNFTGIVEFIVSNNMNDGNLDCQDKIMIQTGPWLTVLEQPCQFELLAEQEQVLQQNAAQHFCKHQWANSFNQWHKKIYTTKEIKQNKDVKRENV